MNNSATKSKKLWALSVGNNRSKAPGHTHSSEYLSLPPVFRKIFRLLTKIIVTPTPNDDDDDDDDGNNDCKNNKKHK